MTWYFLPNGDLFTADNNPDAVDKVLTFLPPEEINHVQEGQHYGFPNIYPPMTHPEDVTEPVVTIRPSVASAGLTYYGGEQFPEMYQGNLFLALWGGRLTYGYRVIRIELTQDDDGNYSGDWHNFLEFNQENPQLSRPIDVTVDPDGMLYIAEYESGVIFRVRYVGEESATAQEQLVRIGRNIYNNGTERAPSCVTCHAGSTSGIGPSLNGIARVAETRFPEQTAQEYLYTSIVDPDSYIVEGFSSGVMYQLYEQNLTVTEIEAIIAYLLTLE